MVILGQIVDTKGSVEPKPNDDDRCKCGGESSESERLNREEYNQYPTGSADYSRAGYTWAYDFESLDSAIVKIAVSNWLFLIMLGLTA